MAYEPRIYRPLTSRLQVTIPDRGRSCSFRRERCPFGRHTGRVLTGANSSTPVQTSVMSRMTPSRTVMKVATSKCWNRPSLSPVT